MADSYIKMKLILKSVTVIDPNSKHNGKTTDVFIQDEKIVKIGKNLSEAGAKIFDVKGACVSPGWFDMNVNFCDPGFETKEDILSGSQAAAKGGYTGIALMPNTNPPLHSKSEIEYVKNKSKNNITDIYPLGTISRDRAGKDLAEMFDMKSSGAIAFSDGDLPVYDAGLMSRALLYAKGINTLIYSYSEDKSIAQKGMMNEGVMSTLLGIKGIPALAEELMIARDIYIAEYNEASVHFTTISTAHSVELIRKAKKKGLKVTADVSVNHLFFDETLLSDFNSNYKVKPPLRTKEDIKALKNGLKDGTIDAITSQHTPEDIEHKNVEFEIAGYGMIGLQTAFALMNMSLLKIMSAEELIEKISLAPRRILNIEIPVIEEGGNANLTIFDMEKEWTLSSDEIVSRSKNTPLTGMKLKGKALAIYNNKQFKTL
jgi:dihydroorotase